MSRILKYILFSVLFLVLSCEEIVPVKDNPLDEENPDYEFGQISGMITSYGANNPIHGSIITLEGFDSTVSNDEGYFQFDSLIHGDYTIIAEAENYLMLSQQITVGPGESKIVNFQLQDDKPKLVIAVGEMIFSNMELSKQFIISNMGTQVLNWSYMTDTGWIFMEPEAGSIAANGLDTVDVLINRSGLQDGIYTGNLFINSDGGNDTVNVEMIVEPILVVSVELLDFSTYEGEIIFFITNPGGGVLNWFILDETDWLTLSVLSGVTEMEIDSVVANVNRDGLESGNYSIVLSITSNGGNLDIPVSMRVPFPPELILSTNLIEFGPVIDVLTSIISNGGDEELIWELEWDEDWISSNPSNGTTLSENDIVSITVDRSYLGSGSYNDTILVTSNGGDENISISMSVVSVLSVSPTYLDFGSDTDQLTFSIMNIGNGLLSWAISDNHEWLDVSESSGTTGNETDHIVVTVDRPSLDAGDYNGTISVASDGGSVELSVNVQVPFPPELIISTNMIDFGTEEESLTFTITNGGDEELIWTLDYDDNWLNATPTSGSILAEQDVITVSVDRSGLAAGDYNGSITVNSNGGDQSVAITLAVPVRLVVSPTYLNFGTYETSQSFTITNIGEGTLNWSITDDYSWIDLWPTSGSTTTEVDEISVSVDRNGLSYGSYAGNIDITSDDGDESVSVDMQVPFYEDFSDLDNWTNDLWAIWNSTNCLEPPCAMFYQYGDADPDIATMSTYVDVVDGQTISFWINQGGLEIELFINNILIWTKSSGDPPSIDLNGTGTIEIKFVASGPEYFAAYVDELIID